MIENILDIDLLSQYLIISNTPYFLFKKFSNDDSVMHLESNFSTKELSKIFDEYTKKEKTGENMVIIYAIITALSFKPYSEVEGIFKEIDKKNIKWLNYFKDIFFSKSVSENILKHKYKYKNGQLYQNKSINSNGRHIINNKPSIKTI